MPDTNTRKERFCWGI